MSSKKLNEAIDFLSQPEIIVRLKSICQIATTYSYSKYWSSHKIQETADCILPGIISKFIPELISVDSGTHGHDALFRNSIKISYKNDCSGGKNAITVKNSRSIKKLISSIDTDLHLIFGLRINGYIHLVENDPNNYIWKGSKMVMHKDCKRIELSPLGSIQSFAIPKAIEKLNVRYDKQLSEHLKSYEELPLTKR